MVNQIRQSKPNDEVLSMKYEYFDSLIFQLLNLMDLQLFWFTIVYYIHSLETRDTRFHSLLHFDKPNQN